MEFATFLVFLAVSVAILYGIDFVLRKWLKIEKVNLSETAGKNINRWGRAIILVVALVLLPFSISGSLWQMLWFWIIYYTVLSLFEATLQWKYARESKEYLLTMIFWPIVMATFILFGFFAADSL
ncbi:DUF4181 domain-containing protein [Planococcus koreensis]|uniref:DUF4181 domain-containing protein n=1 Tax=Planococcus koreensis TaxID=112331 RepID=UPI0039FC18C9